MDLRQLEPKLNVRLNNDAKYLSYIKNNIIFKFLISYLKELPLLTPFQEFREFQF